MGKFLLKAMPGIFSEFMKNLTDKNTSYHNNNKQKFILLSTLQENNYTPKSSQTEKVISKLQQLCSHQA